MLIRLVRMTFDPSRLDDFLGVFDEAQPKIAAVDGCRHLELWRDARYPNVLTTYSLWDSDTHLNAYRHGDLFKTTWAQTKPLFAAPPVAYSQVVERPAVGGKSG
ncbi:MAG: antibiotic biosynthesis monooxygenase family protein [Bacteroidota bacterium]